jgi:AbiU2
MPKFNASRMLLPERISLAKERTAKVMHHLRAIIEMHEANAIIVYSPTLAEQIPVSYAAHAFNQFQSSMHFFEIVRLCALWDGVDRDKENVPTIIELIDDSYVIANLTAETRAHWSSRPLPRSYDSSRDQETQKAIQEAMQRSQEKWADKQAAETASRLNMAIAKAKSVFASPKLCSVLNIRHKHIAHSLTETSLERKGSVHPMKYGDEQWLFEQTLQIVDDLHIGINGASFMWGDAIRIARRNAESLWKSCTFAVAE